MIADRYQFVLRATGCLVAACTCAAVLSGCSVGSPRVPEPSRTSGAPSAVATVAADADRAAAEEQALAIIKHAKSYRASMNARAVSDPAQWLDASRGPGLTIVVRIDRDGVPVDLCFMRHTGELRTVVFGAKGGESARAYDQTTAKDGDAILSLVDKLAEAQLKLQ